MLVSVFQADRGSQLTYASVIKEAANGNMMYMQFIKKKIFPRSDILLTSKGVGEERQKYFVNRDNDYRKSLMILPTTSTHKRDCIDHAKFLFYLL